MKKSIKQILCFAAAGCLGVSASFAVTYDTFGPLPNFTAGGVPDKNVAISTTEHVTLGLAAQQRYSNPAVTDNGAGTYYATTGSNYGLKTPPSSFEGATWNFDFYIQGDATAKGYTYSISYGLDGGAVYSFNPLEDGDAGNFLTTGVVQDSQNLMFATFGGAVNGFAATFDPNADATYDFLLTAKDSAGQTVAQTGIRVIVGLGSSVPDTGSTLALMGVAFAGIAGLRRKFQA